jgi:hypothetical protein
VVYSFAHGRTTYELKYDAASVESALREDDAADAADTLVRLLLAAEVAPDEELRLRDIACKLSGTKARPLAAKMKMAHTERNNQRVENRT